MISDLKSAEKPRQKSIKKFQLGNRRRKIGQSEWAVGLISEEGLSKLGTEHYRRIDFQKGSISCWRILWCRRNIPSPRASPPVPWSPFLQPPTHWQLDMGVYPLVIMFDQGYGSFRVRIGPFNFTFNGYTLCFRLRRVFIFPDYGSLTW
jgi:hypothetical protein